MMDADANIARQFGVESLQRTVGINKEGIITEMARRRLDISAAHGNLRHGGNQARPLR